MFGFYAPLLVLHLICIYHAYRNNAEQRWYWLILFLPLIGCILYIVHQFGNRNLETIPDGVAGVVTSNQRIQQLEKEVNHADSVTNKMNLADAYLAAGRTEQAILLYEQCAAGFMHDDPELRMKLLNAYFLKGDYATAIRYGELLENEKLFKNAEEKSALAWSYYHTGDSSTAKTIFESLDRPFTNYPHRLEYCRFLKTSNQKETLVSRLTEIFKEFESMKGQERSNFHALLNQFRHLQSGLSIG